MSDHDPVGRTRQLPSWLNMVEGWQRVCPLILPRVIAMILLGIGLGEFAIYVTFGEARCVLAYRQMLVNRIGQGRKAD